MERREAGQPRHLRQDDRVPGGAAPHDGSRASMVRRAGRPTDDRSPSCVYALRTHGDDPPRFAPGRVRPQGERLPHGRGSAVVVSRRSLAGRGARPPRGRAGADAAPGPVRRALPDPRGGRRASRLFRSRKQPANPTTPSSLRTDATWPISPASASRRAMSTSSSSAPTSCRRDRPGASAAARRPGRGSRLDPRREIPALRRFCDPQALARRDRGDRAPDTRSSWPACVRRIRRSPPLATASSSRRT